MLHEERVHSVAAGLKHTVAVAVLPAENVI